MNQNLSNNKAFYKRHIGTIGSELEMLKTIGSDSMQDLIEQTVPSSIRMRDPLKIPDAVNENDILKLLKDYSLNNKLYKNFIGQGYYDSYTPSVILRNVFENPGWYTQYTPYQAEISQGRLESLLNFQTMVCDLTAMPVANASLLDESTAAAEAMNMFFHQVNKADSIRAPNFFVDAGTFPQTIDLLYTRAKPLGINIVIGDYRNTPIDQSYFGAVLQYPNNIGSIENYALFTEKLHVNGAYVAIATDLLALTQLTPPGEFGADVAFGNSQRFGVPLGFGGPHAAFFACKEEFKRAIPGRIIGVSIDANGNRALRMALQTREQHIKREKATSNICTAQALLANMAAMYAVYHGPDGLKEIATRVHELTRQLGFELQQYGMELAASHYFDTIAINVKNMNQIRTSALKNKINFRYLNDTILISIDETVTETDVKQILSIFGISTFSKLENSTSVIPEFAIRKSAYLLHPNFNSHHSESQMMRYIKMLENKDLSLNTSMISLGSCTMKLNAATQMMPLSWSHFSKLHPFAPVDQVSGYLEILEELGEYLCEITGLNACSLQPNSGAQGEYAGLLAIRNYHLENNQPHRNIVLIPISAHGTNPASAVMAGMKVVVVKALENGYIDMADFKIKAEQYKENLAAAMVTYPSTYGVFEEEIKTLCDLVHQNGGQVYMDGANMNAQVGLTSPGLIGADVCHLNLHKTFSIPHGGGGPGMGPICVKEHLTPFLPGHIFSGSPVETGAVSAAPFGSASILLISYAYIRLLGNEGVKLATEYAILNANYMKVRLQQHYDILYTGKNGTCAHEFIVDLRPFKNSAGIEAEDVAKRLMDYGFHAPTMSFPVAGTIMIEPTESEDKAELDRFCDAMIAIRKEIAAIENGTMDKSDNPLKNAPHTQFAAMATEWNKPYSRETAVFPLDYIRFNKFWPTVSRINNTFGDRNLVCTCEPVSAYMEETIIT
jgi:glycine dehydrogenase